MNRCFSCSVMCFASFWQGAVTPPYKRKKTRTLYIYILYLQLYKNSPSNQLWHPSIPKTFWCRKCNGNKQQNCPKRRCFSKQKLSTVDRRNPFPSQFSKIFPFFMRVLYHFLRGLQDFFPSTNRWPSPFAVAFPGAAAFRCHLVAAWVSRLPWPTLAEPQEASLAAESDRSISQLP